MTNARKNYIDFLKMISLFGLFFAHVKSPDWLMMLRSFDVPMMVILSAILADCSFCKSDEYKRKNILYIWKRIKRLVFPTWLFLTFLFLVKGIFGITYSWKYYLASYLLSVGRGHEAVGSDIAEQYYGVSDESAVVTAPYVQLDITDEKAVEETIKSLKPDAIFHCAAWTAVDAAEDEENKAKVHAINVDGTRYIAEAAKVNHSKLLYLSTDYVFDGKGTRPWQLDDKNYAPLNYYGQTKLEGEMAVAGALDKFFIVRVAWVFGLNGKNFIKTMINVGKTHRIPASKN